MSAFGMSRARTRLSNEQRALANFERWARTNEWAKHIAAQKTRQLIDQRLPDRMPR